MQRSSSLTKGVKRVGEQHITQHYLRQRKNQANTYNTLPLDSDIQQNAFGSVEYHLSKERDQSKKFLNEFKNSANEGKREALALVSHFRDKM